LPHCCRFRRIFFAIAYCLAVFSPPTAAAAHFAIIDCFHTPIATVLRVFEAPCHYFSLSPPFAAAASADAAAS
jgi:hypothetical protein